MKKLLIFTCILFNSAILLAQINVAATEAKNHIGQVITVCDRIVDAKYLENSMTKPTLLNVGGAFPNHLLTIVINYGDRKNFPFNPEEFYLNKRVCITGTVSDFKGKPQIVALTPAEIKIDESQASSTGSSSAGTPNRTASSNQPNITISPNRPPNSNTQANSANSSVSTNRTNTTNPLDSANRATSPVTSTNPGNTTNPSGSGSRANTTNTTVPGNPSNSTIPGTSTNAGNTTSPSGSGNQTNRTSPKPPANTGSTATPPGPTNRAGTTNSTSSNGGTNTTNRTSDANNGISSAYTIEIGPNLRVRSGPGETFPVTEVAKAGTEVTILGSENGWSHVSYERNSSDQGKSITIEGYIKNSVLNSANTPATATTTTNNSAKKISSPDTKTIDNDANKKASGNSKNSDVYSIKISASLRVRSEPSENSDVVEVLKAGTVVDVIRSENGWSYVSYPGNSLSANAKSQSQKGYIKNSVLK